MSVQNMLLIRERLSVLHSELASQGHVAASYSDSSMSFADEMANLSEYIYEAGEYGVAYECIVAMLESKPFMLSASAAICLLEIGLLLQFKTERPCDILFDSRNQ